MATSTATTARARNTPPTCDRIEQALELSRKFLSFCNHESSCLHLLCGIKAHDPDLCLGKFSPTGIDCLNDVARIVGSEHWQLVHGPIPVIVVSWPHPCVQVDVPIFRNF